LLLLLLCFSPQAAAKLQIPYFYHELTDATWKTVLREPAISTGATAGAATATAAKPQQSPEHMLIMPRDVLGDEHFGLATGDRRFDKELLGEGMGTELVRGAASGRAGGELNQRGPHAGEMETAVHAGRSAADGGHASVPATRRRE
jgi:hypothetical protein